MFAAGPWELFIRLSCFLFCFLFSFDEREDLREGNTKETALTTSKLEYFAGELHSCRGVTQYFGLLLLSLLFLLFDIVSKMFN